MTFAPCLSRLPGLGFCEITCPFFTLREAACLIAPTLQAWDTIARLAALRVLPFTLGTTHFDWGGGGARVKVAVTAESVSIVTTQVPLPEQPLPDQPENVEPALGVAVKVTNVPWA